MTTRRAAGSIGIVSTIVLLVASGVGNTGHQPHVGASAAAYSSWLARYPPGTSLWVSAFAEVIALIGFLFFFCALWAVLRVNAGEWEWLAMAALACGLTGIAVKLASGPIAVVAYDRAPHGLSGDVDAALIESNGWSFVLTFAIDGAFLIAAGSLIVLTRVLPRWLGWAAIVFGILSVLSILGGLDGPPGILLFLAWVLAAGVVLLRAPRPATTP